MEGKNVTVEGRPLEYVTLNDCYAFCPDCGSDVFFSKEGCFCKKSFNKTSNCNWKCVNCSPRKCVSR